MGILVQPIINNKEYGFGIQGKIFDFDIKLTNELNSPSPKFKIVAVKLTAPKDQNFNENFNGVSFVVPELNPNQSIIIHVGKYGHFMFGLVNVHIIVQPDNPSTPIKLLQKNPFTGQYTANSINEWFDFFYIKSLNEHEQEKTNIRMLLLTIVIASLTFFTAVPIIKDFVDFLFAKS